MPNLIHNEQVKLRANFFNSLASSCLTAASITPIGILMFNGPPRLKHLGLWSLGVAILFLAAVIFRYRANRTLKGLRDA